MFGQPPTYVSVPKGPTTMDGASSMGYPLTVKHNKNNRRMMVDAGEPV